MKNKKNKLGFSLLEVLLMVTLFAIILSSTISLIGNKTAKEDINAKARQVVDFVSRAHDYSVNGYFQDVWGIKVLDNDAMCEDNGDCIVLFKGRQYSSRNTNYDRTMNFDTGVYIESDQENEFYFSYMSGWLSSGYNQAIVIKNAGSDENKVIVIETTGLTYVEGQNTYGQMVMHNTAGDFSRGTFDADKIAIANDADGQGVELFSDESMAYAYQGHDMAYVSSTDTIWILNPSITSASVSVLNMSGRQIANYPITISNPSLINDIAYDSHTDTVWIIRGTGDNDVIQMDVADGTILNTVALSYEPDFITFDSYTNSIWVTINNAAIGSLVKIDVDTAATTQYSSMPWTSQASAMTFDSYTNSVWVAEASTQEIHQFDVTDGSLVTSEVVGYLYDLTFDSYTNSIWGVGSNVANLVYKIDVTSPSTVSSYYGARPTSITFDSTTNSVWTPTYDTGDLVQYDVTDGTATTYTKNLYRPSYIIFSPSADAIFVPVGDSPGIGKYSVVDGSVVNYNTFAVGAKPYDIAFDPVTNSIWTIGYLSGIVTKISAIDGSFISSTTIAGATNLTSIVFDSYTNSIWIGDSGTITKLSPTDASTLGSLTLSVAGLATDMTFDSYTNSIWVTKHSANKIVKINPATVTEIGAYDVGTYPTRAAFDSVSNSIWVTSRTDYRATKLSATDGSFISTTSLSSSNAEGIAFDPITNTIMAGRTNFYKIDAATGSNLSTHVLNISSYDMIYEPISNNFWAMNDEISDVDTIAKIDPVSGTIIGSYVVGEKPQALTYDSKTNSVWVSNYTDDTVTKLPITDFAPSGTYISSVIDTYNNTNFNAMTYTAVTPTYTVLTMKVRTSTSSDMVGALDWSSCEVVTSGIDISSNTCVNDGDRYVQYQALLETSNLSTSPRLTDVVINFDNL